jgi:hypothetical protein
MGLANVQRGVIQALNQSISVNTDTNVVLWCTSITRGCGCGSTTAEFRLPQALYDTNRNGLRDSLISVSILNAYGGGSVDVDFLGYLDVDSATLDTSTDSVVMTASTITSYLDKVWVGQTSHVPYKEFPLVDPLTGNRTSNTPASILRELFDELPSFYAARVRLGDLTVINTTSQNNQPALVFRNTTYASAIDSVISLFGDVTYRERFSGGITYLDFFRVQDVAQPINTVTIGTYADIIDCGANVESINDNKSTQDVTTRVNAYGGPRRFIVTAITNDVTAQRRLNKGWDVSLEADVLLDPKIAKPGAVGYQPGMEFVFRRFHLPVCFGSVNRLKNLGIFRNAIAGQPGPQYDAQIFKYDRALAADEDGNITSTIDAEPTLLKSCKLDLDRGYFELGSAEDGLNVLTGVPDVSTGKPVITWTPAVIGVTFCYEDNKNFIYSDTGADVSSGINLDFASDGLTEQFQVDKLKFLQVTNNNYPLTSETGVSLTFNALIYNEDTNLWMNETSANVVTDDTPTLRYISKERLKEKSRRHRAIECTVPYFSRAYRVGNQLRVINQNDPPQYPMMITGITYNLEAPQSTRITADNVKPPKRVDI